MSACPDTGLLRALLDDEAPTGTAEHASACPRCQEELAGLRDDAAFAAAAIELLDASGSPSINNTASAPAAAGAAARTTDLAAVRRARRRSARQRFAAAAAVVTIAVGIVATPAGREAAADFLAQFRSERITVVEIDPQTAFGSFDVLGALGTIETTGDIGMMEGLPDVATAEERLGAAITLPNPALLPSGFDPQPQVLYSPPSTVRLDFDRASVESWLADNGGVLEIPEGLGETTLVVDVPAAVFVAYHSQSFERLVVGQSDLVTAEAQGPVPLEEVREFLLDLPGLPPSVRAQLAGIEDWRSTLPLPIPTDEIDWTEIDVEGTPAVALRGTSGIGSAILWQSDGWVHGVGGLIDEDTARRLAADLVR